MDVTDVTPDFIIYCMFHNIVLSILPPHTSHTSHSTRRCHFQSLQMTELEVVRIQKVEWVSAEEGKSKAQVSFHSVPTQKFIKHHSLVIILRSKILILHSSIHF